MVCTMNLNFISIMLHLITSRHIHLIMWRTWHQAVATKHVHWCVSQNIAAAQYTFFDYILGMPIDVILNLHPWIHPSVNNITRLCLFCWVTDTYSFKLYDKLQYLFILADNTLLLAWLHFLLSCLCLVYAKLHKVVFVWI